MSTSPVPPTESPAPAPTDALDQSVNAPKHSSSRVDITEKPALAAGSGPAFLAMLLILALTAGSITLLIAGGVAANQELRRQLRRALPIDIEYAPIQLCTDNAAMIAALGYFRAQIDQPTNPYDLKVQPSLSMTTI